jgi:ABC-2 type transport system permease protein
MSTVALTLTQVRYENKSFWRNPAAAFFTFTFPLMFLVIFNLLFGSQKTIALGIHINSSNFYVPAIAAFSIITACYTNVAMNISFSRDQGVLKRKRGTPLPGWAYLLGKILHSVFIGILLVAIVTAAGVLFYNVDLPTSTMAQFLVTMVVGAASFSALGLAITSVVPNADAAPAVINGSILPLLFISDVFIPLGPSTPAWLGHVASFFPIIHYAHSMLATFLGQSDFRWGDLAVVGVWGIAGLLVAIRFFTWEPRR